MFIAAWPTSITIPASQSTQISTQVQYRGRSELREQAPGPRAKAPFSPFQALFKLFVPRTNQPSLLAPQTVFVRQGAHNATYFQPITRSLTKTRCLVQWLSTYQLCCGVADQRGGRSFTRRPGTRSLQSFPFYPAWREKRPDREMCYLVGKSILFSSIFPRRPVNSVALPYGTWYSTH